MWPSFSPGRGSGASPRQRASGRASATCSARLLTLSSTCCQLRTWAASRQALYLHQHHSDTQAPRGDSKQTRPLHLAHSCTAAVPCCASRRMYLQAHRQPQGLPWDAPGGGRRVAQRFRRGMQCRLVHRRGVHLPASCLPSRQPAIQHRDPAPAAAAACGVVACHWSGAAIRASALPTPSAFAAHGSAAAAAPGSEQFRAVTAAAAGGLLGVPKHMPGPPCTRSREEASTVVHDHGILPADAQRVCSGGKLRL